jgi:hypothetical protein
MKGGIVAQVRFNGSVAAGDSTPAADGEMFVTVEQELSIEPNVHVIAKAILEAFALGPPEACGFGKGFGVGIEVFAALASDTAPRFADAIFARHVLRCAFIVRLARGIRRAVEQLCFFQASIGCTPESCAHQVAFIFIKIVVNEHRCTIVAFRDAWIQRGTSIESFAPDVLIVVLDPLWSLTVFPASRAAKEFACVLR